MADITNKKIGDYWYDSVLSRDVVPNSYVDGIDGLVTDVESDGTWTIFTLQGGETRRKKPSTAVYARHANQSRAPRFKDMVEQVRSGVYVVGNYVSNVMIDGKKQKVMRHFDGTLLYVAAINSLALNIIVNSGQKPLVLARGTGEIELTSIKAFKAPYRALIEAIIDRA